MRFWIIILSLNLLWAGFVVISVFLGEAVKRKFVRDNQSFLKYWSWSDPDGPDLTTETVGMPPIVTGILTGMCLLMFDIFAIAIWFGAQS